MRQRVLLILVLLALPFVVSAKGYSKKQEHSRGSAFELGVGAGYGTLGYQAMPMPEPLNNSVLGRPSGYVHLAYDCFFSEYVGLSLGGDFTRYGSGNRLSGQMLFPGVVDTDGEVYDHTLTIQKWLEIQSISYVEIPLSLKFSAPAGNVYFIGEVGAKLGIPVLRSYRGSGSLMHTGYYSFGNVTMQNQPNHGFYTEDGYRPGGTFETKTLKWSVFAKLGVAIPLVEHLDLTVQAFGQYAFNGPEVGGSDVPGFRDDRVGGEYFHYFMNPYYSTLHSGLVKEKIKPWHVGLELGLRVTIPHRHRVPCKCYNQQFTPILRGGGDGF